ncbi:MULTISPECIES: LPS O-antigen length regulator [unclassified Pseudoalteromonas]|uniref:LPS O-antigen length regulator n=1 Tax=unclassified Pseudoalteromonas TaxID=194690 RepID=UPI00386A1D16
MTDVKVNVVKAEYNDFFEIVIGSILKYKIFNILFVLSIAIFSVFFALSIPNQYRSESLLTSTESSGGGVAGMLGQLSGVASLAGISLGGGDEKAVFHLEEKLKSRDFLIPFLKKHNIKIPLFAAEDWTQSSNTLVYDSSIYDFNNNKWLRDVDYPLLPEPTNEEAYKKFREIFKVSFDRKKAVFKLSVDFYSPEIAKQWLSLLIEEFNEYERELQLLEVNNNLKFLNGYLQQAEYTEVRASLYDLIEDQLKKMMVSKTKKDFALNVIQAPYIPEEKQSPKRALICLGITFLGVCIALLISIIRFVNARNK